MTITLRYETPVDISTIAALTAAAFLHAEHTSHTEQFIVNALRQAGVLTLSLVAEQQGEIIGHAAISPITLSGGTSGWFGLGPVSVLPDHQGQGIGSQLIRQLIADLQQQGAAGCVVLGNPHYYGRFGFQPQAGLILPGVPAEFFMALPFGGPLPQGEVAFHPGFNATA